MDREGIELSMWKLMKDEDLDDMQRLRAMRVIIGEAVELGKLEALANEERPSAPGAA
jgi:hypothetical protein